jgi:hypothetical protein
MLRPMMYASPRLSSWSRHGTSALRDHVIAPILAGSVAPPRPQAQDLDLVDRDYEILRIGMQALFRHVGIATRPAAASTTSCPSE